ncbi:hypothetical protein [Glycomyces buryatensis]|uniref:Uncharacterized protein n=1 Tax=Glycomyces buryatensis TaxID=2570927 RepID=A0A4S8QJG4_9ACTN|nr:hypothetical protein [Glycomyces buryatensis]THV43402.1 hypothetical protein FAB82_01640 [Glycomyces buryatensis]
MTQAPEDFPAEPRAVDNAADPRFAAHVPSQRPAPAPSPVGEPVMPAADPAAGQAIPAEPAYPAASLPQPTAPGMPDPGAQYPGAQQTAQYPPAQQYAPGMPQQAGAPPVDMLAPPPVPPGWQQYPPGFYPPRPERRRSRVGTVFMVVALVAASVLSGAFVNGWRPSLPGTPEGTFNGAAVEPGEGELPSPGEDASESEILAYLKEQAQLVLDAHSESLINRSPEGWLAAFDPTLHEEMTSRYDSLAAMEVSRFDYQVTSGPLEDSSGAVPLYDITVAVSYCFATPADECSPADVVFDTVWRAGDEGMVMVQVDPSEGGDGPHPWEVTDMVAAVGERTVVAVPENMADELDAALEVSEAAAENADEWAKWEVPDRYVVYIAGDEEFEEWFGGIWDSGDVLGFALPLSGTVDGERVPSTYATVMAVDRTGWGAELDSVIRHELGHAVTLWAAPSERYANDTWWMVEGIAEYIDHGERDYDEYERAWDVEEYVAQGGCETDILPPDEDDDTLAGSGKYGCGFLGVTYMINTYGEDEFAEWFGLTAREGQSPDESAESIFGKSNAELMEEITAFIAQTV